MQVYDLINHPSTLGGATGTLTLLTPSTVTTISGQGGIAIDPSRRYRYAATGNGFQEFAVGSGGLLAAMANPDIAGTTNSNFEQALDPSGRSCYGLSNSDTILQFAILSEGQLRALPSRDASSGGSGFGPTAVH